MNTEKAPEAHVLLLATLAHAKLLYGDHEGTKNDIDAAWKVLDELSGVDPSVNAAYYGVAADYYKVRDPRVAHLPLYVFLYDRSLTSVFVPDGHPSCPVKGRVRAVLQELTPLPCMYRSCEGPYPAGARAARPRPWTGRLPWGRDL